METISLQFMCCLAEIASKIRRRVWSARALDIFSIRERSIGFWKCIRAELPLAIRIRAGDNATEKDATDYFDSHLNIEIQKAGRKARNLKEAFRTKQTRTGDNHEEI